jgi:hypothetical protein
VKTQAETGGFHEVFRPVLLERLAHHQEESGVMKGMAMQHKRCEPARERYQRHAEQQSVVALDGDAQPGEVAEDSR